MSPVVNTRIGELRHLMVLEAPPSGQTATGALDRATWTVQEPEVRARYTDLTAANLKVGAGFQQGITGMVRIRYTEGVAVDMRFRFGDRLLYIRTVVDPDRRGRWLDCYTEERPAA